MVRCKRCEKELTKPESIARGYGDICAMKLGLIPDTSTGKTSSGAHCPSDQTALRLEGDRNMESGQKNTLPPFRKGDNIILKRVSQCEVDTNVPHSWINHSPDGFNWGYLGSGCAELALNILILFVDRDLAWELHQRFKEDYLAGFAEEGGEIEADEIEAWIEENRT